ncbi:phage portal protein [Sphingomonas sp. gentR]|uniref:phage portal protein n=1 Tax=Sphingomonas sp. gentR TaxID=3118768 RepID=UPI00177F7841
MSPDDYRTRANHRRSEAPRQGRLGGGPPVQAFTAMDIDSPVLREFMGVGRTSAAGVTVSEKVALRNSGFFRASKLISTSIGMLPTHLMRRTADGRTQKAKDHPLYRLLHKRPNGYQTALEFKAHMQLCALLDGNAYARVVWGVKGGRRAVIALIPFKRRSITPNLGGDGEISFRYQPDGGDAQTLSARDVFHFRHPVSLDGIKGVSLLDVAVETLGLASAAERALGKLLDKGVMAGGAIEFAAELGDEAYERLRTSLAEDHSGVENAGDWLILEDGGKANPFVANAKDNQTDELRKRQVEEVARFTDVPRPLLMMDETAWGSGIEQLGLYFVTYCLLGWFIAWEQAIERSCLTEAEQDADELYIKFNEGALLRGSLKDQADFFSKALGNNGAWMSPNEVRGNFDLDPREDGRDLPKPSTTKPASPSKDTTND